MYWLIAGSLLVSLASCDSSQVSSATNSVGGFDEILIVADDASLDVYLKKPLQQTFLASYDVLPQDEPLFDARIISYTNFDRFFQKFRTVVFVADLSQKNTITDFVIEQIGEENTAKALNNSDFNVAIKSNLWAKPQIVIFLFARSKDDLLHLLKAKSKSVTDFVSRNELEKYTNNVYFNGLNQELTQKLMDEAAINLKIPKDYVLAIQGENFFWIRNIADEFDNNIMISWRDWNGGALPDAVEWRNELGKKYISTSIDSSYMISDTLLPFFTNKIKINDMPAVETRGLWKMVNDFMGGPFINYIIADEKNRRVILLDGFVYAPGEKNKPLLRKIEAILRQLGAHEVQ